MICYKPGGWNNSMNFEKQIVDEINNRIILNILFIKQLMESLIKYSFFQAFWKYFNFLSQILNLNKKNYQKYNW